ncbi:hypothetical protein ASD56_09690 [Microbacterium sp. Root166]|uniref:DUF349 domain-containing protein n=1 Tax=Microbacterium sp. Root166 TaxID=1736478 RepID=UPI0006F5DE62|nr:DUF349 domain-containing protein [Microbacterium sp. Root166]KQZ84638.1 hypothetical protein ASD56_09690 [Microbacterium sp. Root166]
MTAAAESTPESTGPATESDTPENDAISPEIETPEAESPETVDAVADAPEAEAPEAPAVEAPDTDGEDAAPEVEAAAEAAPAEADVEPDSPEAEADAPEAANATASEAEAAEAPAETASEPAAAAPAPAPRPTPTPRPTPAAAARPKPTPAPGAAAAAPKPAPAGEPWGRVEEDGTVSVREASGWRVVGQYPDGTPEEALAYFERKYADLASEVTLLEVRRQRAGASASDLRGAARAVSAKLHEAAAVGDLASLEARVLALTESLAAASETEAAAAREAVDDAVRVRTELVEKAEALAARDPRTVQWKQATAELNELFEQWQSQQQNGPRLPKSTAQQLWKRFRDARSIVDKHRREFYAELDEAHKGVRERKTKLVEKAEALAPKGEDGIAAYRELLDQWKTAGRAGKKVDDALWARFKTAGDALYSARIERESAENEASREKIETRKALLEEAKAVADERDIAKARSLLTSIQRRWDEVGRIFPRDAERALDDDLRKIENALRTREESDWKRNNPETKARANDMTRQLMDAIGKLEDAVATAKKSGDKKAIADATDALEARRAWLKALGG